MIRVGSIVACGRHVLFGQQGCSLFLCEYLKMFVSASNPTPLASWVGSQDVWFAASECQRHTHVRVIWYVNKHWISPGTGLTARAFVFSCYMSVAKVEPSHNVAGLSVLCLHRSSVNSQESPITQQGIFARPFDPHHWQQSRAPPSGVGRIYDRVWLPR